MSFQNYLTDAEEVYYTNAEELLSEDDLIEVDVKIPGWKRKFRIRALNFEQMEKIDHMAQDDKGEFVQKEFILGTILEGVIRPKFNSTQVRKLLEKNGAWVRELSDEIWTLGRISKTTFDEYFKVLKEAKEAEQKPK